MVTYQETDTQLICAFTGALNTAGCQSFEKELLEKTAASQKNVVFDLEKVSYISSAFLRICIQHAKTKGITAFFVTNVSPEVKRVFKIAGLDQLFQMPTPEVP